MSRTIPILLVAASLLLAVESADARRLSGRAWSAHAQRSVQGHLHAEFTSHFKVRQYGRSANVRKAARRLHNVAIPPYGTFSYNRTVGP
ncbi:MAG: vancomycin resistance protein YoaR, partial [Myxococcota bacterium]